MEFRIDKSLSITMIIVAIVAALVYLLFPWQTAKSQTAGSFDMTFQYSAGVDKAMQRQHGTDWIPVIRERLREAWKNHRSSAQEAYKAGLSEIFTDELDPELLTKPESNQLQRLVDSLAVRKARKTQREADSLAALNQTTGELVPPDAEPIDNGTLYVGKQTSAEYLATLRDARNVGKALSPRMLFTEFDSPATEGGGGGKPLEHGRWDLAPGGAGWVVVAVIVAVVVAGLASYGLYYGVRWAVRR